MKLKSIPSGLHLLLTMTPRLKRRMLINLFHRFLFTLDPERAHYLALKSMQWAYRLGLHHFYRNIPEEPFQLMNLTFPNRIGLAAGFDKNADYVDALAALGFGFIEVGTITPKPQAGNPQPRLFRLTDEEAIINRMGFNNKGIEHVVRQLEKTKFRGILGINIGKNRDTAMDHAIDDYVTGFKSLWPFASYITINISSPNTANLRDLQQADLLQSLLKTLKSEQQNILQQHKKYVPLVVKISPDLSETEVHAIAEILMQQKIDGVIATNTTITRIGVEQSIFAKEAGGLSGRPLTKRSTEIVAQLHSILQQNIPIIAAGGVMDQATAQEKLNAGASLLQIYTGFIYSGPALIKKLRGLK